MQVNSLELNNLTNAQKEIISMENININKSPRRKRLRQLLLKKKATLSLLHHPLKNQRVNLKKWMFKILLKI
jgi:hypothetical protein